MSLGRADRLTSFIASPARTNTTHALSVASSKLHYQSLHYSGLSSLDLSIHNQSVTYRALQFTTFRRHSGITDSFARSYGLRTRMQLDAHLVRPEQGFTVFSGQQPLSSDQPSLRSSRSHRAGWGKQIYPAAVPPHTSFLFPSSPTAIARFGFDIPFHLIILRVHRSSVAIMNLHRSDGI